jgi:predicted transcriptional regulator
MKKNLPKPTDAELALLSVLWRRGPSTVREVHDSLPEAGTGYTTTLKILQKMTEKGLVKRDESQRSHIYSVAMAAEQTQRQLLRDLLRRAFEGSPARLVMQALAAEPASAEELAAIRQLLDNLETKARKDPKQ